MGDQPVLAHDPADHLLRDTRPGRGLDPPVPVPALGIGERPRHAGAQPGVLVNAEPRVVVVVAAGRDTAASMSATSANTSASAGRPASSSPGSTGAAGRRPGLFYDPEPPPASTRSPDSSSRIRRRSTSGSSPNGSLSVPACGMASLRPGLRRRHSTGAVQSHPMMHRTGADAKLRRHLLLLHTRQAQFHRATPRPQRYGRLGDGIRIPGIVAQPPFQTLPGRIPQMLHHLLRGHRCGEIQLHRPLTLLATGHGNNPSAQSPRKRPQPPTHQGRRQLPGRQERAHAHMRASGTSPPTNGQADATWTCPDSMTGSWKRTDHRAMDGRNHICATFRAQTPDSSSSTLQCNVPTSSSSPAPRRDAGLSA